MPGTRMDQRFLASTRGRVVALLRGETRTVDELARALELTDNAIRAHLATLERDGLVEQGELRRGGGKPAHSYKLTTDAENLFPKPYTAVLRRLLDLLAEQRPTAQLTEILRETGRRLAVTLGIPSGAPSTRLEATVAMLNGLGGLAELQRSNGSVALVGRSCPLAEVIADRPEACALAETLVSEFVGAPVREQCTRGNRPQCRFEVAV